MRAPAAVVGLGMSGPSRSDYRPAYAFACEAIAIALEDSGLRREDVDGLLISRSGASSDADLSLALRDDAGLGKLSMLSLVYGEGTSAAQTLQMAALAIAAGQARTVVCVYADAPVKEGKPARSSFGRVKSLQRMDGLRYAAGLFGGAALYGLATRRHMYLYGLKPSELAAVAISTRQWAQRNPRAVFRSPLDLDDYLAARWIVEPLRLFDCAVPVNGGIAVVLTSPDRAPDLQQMPVYIRGMGQGHSAEADRIRYEASTFDAARVARDQALVAAGITLGDIDVCEIYDAFSFIPIAMLEAYGFCALGEGGAFVASGAVGPGGSLPMNTGGGHLSAHYLQGMTPIVEAVEQVRGTAGERQCARNDFVLVTNEGGRFDHHANLIFSPHRGMA